MIQALQLTLLQPSKLQLRSGKGQKGAVSDTCVTFALLHNLYDWLKPCCVVPVSDAHDPPDVGNTIDNIVEASNQGKPFTSAARL